MAFSFDLGYWETRAVCWSAALALAVLGKAVGRWPGAKAAGIGIMSVPAWFTGVAILESIGPLIEGGAVLRAWTTYELSYVYSQKILGDVGYLAAGMLVWACGASPRRLFAMRVRDLARKVADAGLPVGRLGEGASAIAGWLLTPALLIGALLVDWATSDAAVLRDSDESSLWANMTPYHALMVSLAAGFGEELLYRGFLQSAFRKAMPVWLAVGVQAAIFGFAHAGYGNWLHVLQPFLFGIFAGIVALRLGIWAAIATHTMVDVYAFWADAAANAPWWGLLLTGVAFANVVAMAWTGGYLAWRWAKRRKTARPA